MRKINRLETLDKKIYVIPLMIISLLFVLSGFFLMRSIRNHYYDLKKDEATKLAASYAHTISKFTEAKDVVDGLLDNKLEIAAKSVVYFEEDFSNEVLKELAAALEVDEIDYYDNKGLLVYSNMENLIGWTVFPGHPIDGFLKSEKASHVEDIRQDAITGDYLKYGYRKLKNGGMIQVGIRANTVWAFLDRFRITRLLSEMKDNEDAIHIDILNDDFEVIGSSDPNKMGLSFYDQKEREDFEKDGEYSHIHEMDEEKHYEVMIPMSISGEDIAALAVGYSLEDTTRYVRNVSLSGLGILGLIYASLLFNMNATYHKNKRLLKAAYRDSLTDLPNNLYLEHYLGEILQEKSHQKKALMLINITSFKTVNLTYGYGFGDQVIKALAKRLQDFQKNGMKLFRFSGDRFVLLHEDYISEERLLMLSDEMVKTFKAALHIQGFDLYLGIRMGIVVLDESYVDVNEVLKDASLALEHLKTAEGEHHLFYSEDMARAMEREDIIVKEIRGALEKEDGETLFLHYQPLLDAKSGLIQGFEALGRMRSGSLGTVSPLEFIEAAEKNTLIVELGSFFLKQAITFMNELNVKGHGEIRVAVNVSGIQLLQSGFSEMICDRLRSQGVLANQLELEITESVFLDSFELINEKLRTLGEQGVTIALDDFGTGYSSFVRLRELNIDTLKIDRHFVNRITEPGDKAISGDIIRMAHRFGLKVVAEGVETVEQKAYLVEHGCDILQGYLFSPAVSAEDALGMLHNQSNL